MTNDIIDKHFEIPCHYDLWMQGAQYGTVTKVVGGTAYLRMDNKVVKKLVKIPVDDLLEYGRKLN